MSSTPLGEPQEGSRTTTPSLKGKRNIYVNPPKKGTFGFPIQVRPPAGRGRGRRQARLRWQGCCWGSCWHARAPARCAHASGAGRAYLLSVGTPLLAAGCLLGMPYIGY